ncbi:MAG TPA: dihydroorotate dehydrogenase-like protein [Candidatus Binatia bacterium]|jgi:dihydroorotate dehydrogenase (fumarate)
MDLSTNYLGLRLPNPLVPGASPLSDDLDTVKQLEDAGAAAIVLRSLFEEQITREAEATRDHWDSHDDAFAEAVTFFPSADSFVLGPDEYLNHVRRVKQMVRIPVIGSLNGMTPGGWLSYAHMIEQAGADALELNVYHAPTDLETSGNDVERDTLEMVRQVKTQLKIPLAVKLSPYFTAFAHFARRLDRVGADGLVLFNRYYDPDIDVQELNVLRTLQLSDSSDLPLRLRGIAALAGRIKASLAVTGGVHTALDVLKATMAGAHITQMVSALLKNGPGHLEKIRADLESWMQQNEWSSLNEMRGNMSQERIPNPQIYDRANYMMMLQTWERP